jgi:LuxR family maltose regulon positive regulatory protein
VRADASSSPLRLLAYTNKILAAFVVPLSMDGHKNGSVIDPLSARELEILRMIATGLSNEEIAAILVVAVSTVKTHINSLYSKLGTHRRTQAVAIARELGVLVD